MKRPARSHALWRAQIVLELSQTTVYDQFGTRGYEESSRAAAAMEKRTPATEKPARKFVSLEGTKFHWLVGAKDPEAINPDCRRFRSRDETTAIVTPRVALRSRSHERYEGVAPSPAETGQLRKFAGPKWLPVCGHSRMQLNMIPCHVSTRCPLRKVLLSNVYYNFAIVAFGA
jgi:hypothetical protein